jgi:hypothetical protein
MSPLISKVSSGSMEFMDINIVSNPSEFIKSLKKDYKILGAQLERGMESSLEIS